MFLLAGEPRRSGRTRERKAAGTEPFRRRQQPVRARASRCRCGVRRPLNRRRCPFALASSQHQAVPAADDALLDCNPFSDLRALHRRKHDAKTRSRCSSPSAHSSLRLLQATDLPAPKAGTRCSSGARCACAGSRSRCSTSGCGSPGARRPRRVSDWRRGGVWFRPVRQGTRQRGSGRDHARGDEGELMAYRAVARPAGAAAASRDRHPGRGLRWRGAPVAPYPGMTRWFGEIRNSAPPRRSPARHSPRTGAARGPVARQPAPDLAVTGSGTRCVEAINGHFPIADAAERLGR